MSDSERHEKKTKNAAIMFDGVNDTINIPHHADLNFFPAEEFSVSIQVMPHSLDRKGMLVGKISTENGNQEGWGIYHSGTDVIFFFGKDFHTGDGLVVIWKEVLREFSWSTLRLSFKGGTIPEVLLYKDGKLLKDAVITGKVIENPDTNADLFIASRNNVDLPFHGKFSGCTIKKHQSGITRIIANWENGFESSFPTLKDTLGQHDGKVSNTPQSIIVYDYKEAHSYDL